MAGSHQGKRARPPLRAAHTKPPPGGRAPRLALPRLGVGLAALVCRLLLGHGLKLIALAEIAYKTLVKHAGGGGGGGVGVGIATYPRFLPLSPSLSLVPGTRFP